MTPGAADEPRDCAFDTDGLWFRHRAAAVILRDGCVLMARNDVDDYHYSIGGGVHHGESAVDAVRREVFEETGVRMEVERLLFVHENFFTMPGRTCHELTIYFLMRLDDDVEVRPHEGLTMGDVREWHEWVPLASYGRERPAHPAFFATALQQLPEHPVLVTTRE